MERQHQYDIERFKPRVERLNKQPARMYDPSLGITIRPSSAHVRRADFPPVPFMNSEKAALL